MRASNGSKAGLVKGANCLSPDPRLGEESFEEHILNCVAGGDTPEETAERLGIAVAAVDDILWFDLCQREEMLTLRSVSR
jgi:hypothetical protein